MKPSKKSSSSFSLPPSNSSLQENSELDSLVARSMLPEDGDNSKNNSAPGGGVPDHDNKISFHNTTSSINAVVPSSQTGVSGRMGSISSTNLLGSTLFSG